MELLPFILLLALATAIQTYSGFSFGMLLMGGISVLGLMPLNAAALMVGILSLFNIITALHGQLRYVQVRALFWILLTGLPAIVIGVWLLDNLVVGYEQQLKNLLGLAIIASCLLQLARRQPTKPSSPAAFYLAGSLGGLLGGMFSTFGPPVIYLFYRQPWTITDIRATLFAVFTVTTLLRIGVVVVSGLPAVALGDYLIAGIPVVLITTWICKRVALPISAQTSRKVAYALLLGCGAGLLLL